jgi:hypothetical protein
VFFCLPARVFHQKSAISMHACYRASPKALLLLTTVAKAAFSFVVATAVTVVIGFCHEDLFSQPHSIVHKQFEGKNTHTPK